MSFHYETLKAAWPLSIPQPAAPAARSDHGVRLRLDSIDLLRGLVMVVMALDHTRDFFSASGMNPRDVADPALFLTRWVTHFCAPIFIFLAGVSAYLYGARGRSRGEISRYLVTRGFWLIVLEFTIMRLGWSFGLNFSLLPAQVIWAIGASMVALAALIWLPRAVIAAIAVAMIAGHNLFDGMRAADLGALGWIWTLLHQPGFVSVGSAARVYVLYPLIPWIGVMAAGYALGAEFARHPGERRRRFFALGAALTLGFVLLRLSNVYGDPAPWMIGETTLSTVLSVLNVEKYPPSLLYLMMTLGPGLMLLAAFEHARGKFAAWITTFGRVPLFYYVAHIFLIHALAVAAAWALVGEASWLIGGSPSAKPTGWGLPLPVVYAVWVMVVVTLYPLCRWFAEVKRRRGDWWLSYL